MLKIKFIVLGVPTEKFYAEGCKEYLKRLTAHAKVTEIQLKEAYLPKGPNNSEISSALEKEAEMIEKELSPKTVVIPLCIEGKEFDSPALAEYIDKKATDGFDEIAFIIGSSHGLSDRIKNKASLKLSMSKLTFPHSLARLMLYEAVYRAFEINKGSGYHK